MITYKFILSIGISGAEHVDYCTVDELGYTDEEWRALSAGKQFEEMEDAYVEWRDNYFDGGFWEVEADDDSE